MDLNHLSKAKAKYIRSLHALKHRQKYNKYIAEGHKICKEIIISKQANIQHIVATEKWIFENQDILNPFTENTFIGSTADLRHVSALTTATDVILVADQPKLNDKVSLRDDQLVLYLDGIRNPGNMGAVIRIADWYGMDKIACSSDCVDIYNPKVIQASMGSFLRVQSVSYSLDDLKAQGFKILGAAMNGKAVEDISISEPLILIIGNEGKGISAAASTLVDQWISIDGSNRLGAESLNAAVATGILVDQIIRKKG